MERCAVHGSINDGTKTVRTGGVHRIGGQLFSLIVEKPDC